FLKFFLSCLFLPQDIEQLLLKPTEVLKDKEATTPEEET
ncbi:hypothetical protein HKBW3S03_01703, partial [Candidatus Hakubella thermalkaliphila]